MPRKRAAPTSSMQRAGDGVLFIVPWRHNKGARSTIGRLGCPAGGLNCVSTRAEHRQAPAFPLSDLPLRTVI